MTEPRERESGFWSGFGSGVVLELLTWVLFAVGAGVVSALGLPLEWNIAAGIVLVVAIVLVLRHCGGRRRRE